MREAEIKRKRDIQKKERERVRKGVERNEVRVRFKDR